MVNSSQEVQIDEVSVNQALNAGEPKGSPTNGTHQLTTLFQLTRSSPTPKNIKEFIYEAQKLALDLPRLESHLTILETAKIISSQEKYKMLFHHAVRLGKPEEAQSYLKKGAIDRSMLCKELLEADELAQLALEVLCKGELALTSEEASIPHLLTFASLNIDINQLTFNKKSFFVTALQTQNDQLIEATIKKGPRLSQDLLNTPAVRQYYAPKVNCSGQELTVAHIIEYHKSLGISFNVTKAQILREAAQDDNPELVKQCVGTEESPDDSNNSPLEIVIKQNPNCLKVVEQLLKNGVSPDQPFSDGVIPLYHAYKQNNPALVRLFVKYDADLCVTVKDESLKDCYTQKKTNLTNPPFFLLLANSEVAEMRDICKQESLYKQENFPKFTEGLGDVHPTGKKHLLPTVIDYIAGIVPKESYYTDNGMQFLFAMCRIASMEVMKKFFTGLDLFKKQECGTSIFATLLKSIPTNPNRASVLAYLIQLNFISADAKTPEDQPLILWALDQRNHGLFTFLLKRGAQTNIRAPNNQTPLHVACEKNAHDSVVALTMQTPITIPINALDDFGNPALYYALGNPASPINNLLLRGAHPFFLHKRLIEYVKHVSNNNLHAVLGRFPLWKQFLDSKAPDFIEYLKSIEKSAETHRTIAEAGFLIPQFPIKIAKDHLLAALRYLRKTYPEAPNDYFYSYFFSPLPVADTASMTLEDLTPEMKPTQLLDLFDRLNWDTSDEANYVDPENVKIGKKEMVLPEPLQKDGLRKCLETAIAKLSDKQVLCKSLIGELTKIQSKAKLTKYLLMLAWSAKVGDILFESILSYIYKRITTKKKKSLLLSDLYLEYLQQVRQVQGKKYGNNTLDFQILYSARWIIPRAEKFLNGFHSTGDSMVADWFMNHIPQSFSCKEETEFRWSMETMDLSVQNPETKRQALIKIFEKKGYPSKPDLSIEAMLKTIRGKNFLRELVFKSNGELKVEAVIYFLQKHGIVQEINPGLFSEFIKQGTPDKSIPQIDFEVEIC